MGRFVLGRVLQAIATLILVSMLVFVASSMTGDPIRLLLPLDAPPAQVEAIRRSLGLDQPLYVQYAIYIGKVLQGDLGNSIRGAHPVSDLVFPAMVNSAKLGLVAMLLVVAVGIPGGIIAGATRGSFADRAIRGVAVFAQAVPGFWLAIVLIQLFAVQFPVFPALGMGSVFHYVLPAFAAFLRLLRSSIIDELGQQYVTAARAKGLSPRVVMRRHVLRNALIPVLTFSGMSFGMLVSGSIVVETVFAWPGLGRLTFEAITARDFPVIQAVILVAGAFVVLVNLLVDLLYGVVDPRIGAAS
jgi:peptide/nickel transport system permease protein